MPKTTKVARNDKTAAKELALLEKIKAHLEDGNRLAKTFDGAEDEEEEEWLKELQSSDIQTGYLCSKCCRR